MAMSLQKSSYKILVFLIVASIAVCVQHVSAAEELESALRSNLVEKCCSTRHRQWLSFKERGDSCSDIDCSVEESKTPTTIRSKKGRDEPDEIEELETTDEPVSTTEPDDFDRTERETPRSKTKSKNESPQKPVTERSKDKEEVVEESEEEIEEESEDEDEEETELESRRTPQSLDNEDTPTRNTPMTRQDFNIRDRDTLRSGRSPQTVVSKEGKERGHSSRVKKRGDDLEEEEEEEEEEDCISYKRSRSRRSKKDSEESHESKDTGKSSHSSEKSGKGKDKGHHSAKSGKSSIHKASGKGHGGDRQHKTPKKNDSHGGNGKKGGNGKHGGDGNHGDKGKHGGNGKPGPKGKHGDTGKHGAKGKKGKHRQRERVLVDAEQGVGRDLEQERKRGVTRRTTRGKQGLRKCIELEDDPTTGTTIHPETEVEEEQTPRSRSRAGEFDSDESDQEPITLRSKDEEIDESVDASEGDLLLDEQESKARFSFGETNNSPNVASAKATSSSIGRMPMVVLYAFLVALVASAGTAFVLANTYRKLEDVETSGATGNGHVLSDFHGVNSNYVRA